MLAAVRERGPVTARHLDEEFSGPRTKQHWGWNWSDARQVLDYLFLVGDVAIAGRTSQFEVLYDVPERVLPRAVLELPTPTAEEAGRELIRRAARSHGVGTAGCLADYYRMRTIPGADGQPSAQQAIADLVEAGELEQVERRGLAEAGVPPRRRPPAARDPGPHPAEPVRPGGLAARAHRGPVRLPLPDRDLRPGAPAAVRLLRAAVPARRRDRRPGSTSRPTAPAAGCSSTAAYAEAGAPAETAAELAAELWRLAGWLGLSEVVVGDRGDLAVPLLVEVAAGPERSDPAGEAASPLFRGCFLPVGSMADGPSGRSPCQPRSQSPVPAILDKILRIGEGKILRQLETIAEAVNAIEDDFVAMSDDELRGMTEEFRKRLADGETLDDLMPEAFATVREAAKRVHRPAPLRRPDHGRRRARTSATSPR